MKPIKVPVDCSALDTAIEKAERLLELLHKVQEAIHALADQKSSSLDINSLAASSSISCQESKSDVS